ncbi:MAG: 16S rRNA (guanine(527)-N(7))-methyltransferase RsmG [Bacillota bacterium]
MWNSQDKEQFSRVLFDAKPDLTEEEGRKLLEYAAFVVEENEKVNLTAIKKPDEFAIKHVVDSLMVLEHVELKGKRIIDVGTGAGMPGLIWACVNNDAQFVLLDSLNKRVAFLERAVSRLGLSNVQAIHYRAEDAGQNRDHRENYQIATARAVASLSVLLEYCLPFVEPNGQFIALKGPYVEQETQDGKEALKVLGGEISTVINYELPLEMGSRSLVVVRKTAKTPRRYPRKAGTPSKSPL